MKKLNRWLFKHNFKKAENVIETKEFFVQLLVEYLSSYIKNYDKKIERELKSKLSQLDFINVDGRKEPLAGFPMPLYDRVITCSNEGEYTDRKGKDKYTFYLYAIDIKNIVKELHLSKNIKFKYSKDKNYLVFKLCTQTSFYKFRGTKFHFIFLDMEIVGANNIDFYLRLQHLNNKHGQLNGVYL